MSKNPISLSGYEALRAEHDRLIDVERPPEDLSIVRFGATVLLTSDAGKTMTATLVGKDEIDPMNGRFSLESPIGKALLGLRLGETAVVRTPRGEVSWTVGEIRY